MKATHWITFGLVLMALAGFGVILASAEAIKVGDTSETVIKELGKPQGRISSGIHDVFLYDRGKVELKEGLVTNIELVSAEEAAARKMAQAKRQEEAAQRALELRESRRAEGAKVMADHLADTSFRAQSAGEQLEYWDLFKNQYPEIDIGSVYANLSRQYQVELEQARVREQLADLQQRTAAAEARALRAEQAAEEAYSTRQTVTYLSYPWVQNYPYNYRPQPSYNDSHPAPPTPRYTVTHPHPITPACPVTPAPRKTPPGLPKKPDGSSCSTGVTFNVKSGAVFK